jgi:membrane protein
VRGRRQEKSGIIEVGERSVRNFVFEQPMATYAAALAYRGLFGLLPFVFIGVVLVGALGFPDFFGVAVALWFVSAVARTLTDAFNVAYQVAETRRWWKQFALSLAFGPILALVVIISVALMLVGTRLVECIAELVGLDELFVHLWGWLRFPATLFLLAVVLSAVYRFGPNAGQRFRSVVPGAALCVVLWAVSSVGFSFYLANFADYGLTYGSLGAAVGLLFYLYLCASVVLLGAELNDAIYHPPTDAGAKDENSGKRTRGGHKNEQRKPLPAEVEHVRRQLASPGATRPRRPVVRACGSLLAWSRPHRAGRPVRHLRGG